MHKHQYFILTCRFVQPLHLDAGRSLWIVSSYCQITQKIKQNHKQFQLDGLLRAFKMEKYSRIGTSRSSVSFALPRASSKQMCWKERTTSSDSIATARILMGIFIPNSGSFSHTCLYTAFQNQHRVSDLFLFFRAQMCFELPL